MQQLFFSLIQVSLGNRETLSRVPTADEWQQLYDMADRQAILGICFVGVSRLHELSENPASCILHPALKNNPASNPAFCINLPRKLFIRWAGRAAIIQERNELLDRYCDTLTTQFREAGFDTCILKGQGVAQLYKYANPYTLHSTLYTLNLSSYRQPGDIDIWMWPRGEWAMPLKQRRKKVLNYLRSIGECDQPTYHHTDVKLGTDIPVEAHYTPLWMYSPFTNRRLQRWFDSMAPTEMQYEFSTLEFNRLFILVHIFRHFLYEGIGFRQLIDYYFVLRSYQQSVASNQQVNESTDSVVCSEVSPLNNSESGTLNLIKQLGLEKFASALLWVINEVCIGYPSNHEPIPVACSEVPPLNNLGIEPNEKEGRFLLNEIMQAGNFGHFDTRYNYKSGDNLLSRFIKHVSRNLHFLTHYPSEVLWSPIWKLWHFLWRKWYRYL